MKEFGRLTCGFVPLALSLLLFGGCSLVPRVNALLPGNRAFIVQWPAKPGSKQLKLAVKDNIDMEGVVTTAGSEYFAKTRPPAKKDAACLAIARQRNVHIVGKANLTEFAVSPSGCNDYFGTPRNPFNLLRSLIPGGSSCGSAAAVASGMANVAFGTDTAGSIRVPAACCGIVGLKTTHGLVSIDGVFPIEPDHLDTVGPMGKDIASTAQGMALLQNGFAAKYAAAQAANPIAENIRVGRLTLKGTDRKIDAAIDQALAKAGFQVVPLDDGLREKWEQAKRDGNVMAAAGVWISDKNFRQAVGVTSRTKAAIFAGRISYPKMYREALARRAEWQNTLQKVFTKVDFIALPTLQTMPIPIPKVVHAGHPRSAYARTAEYRGGKFRGQPCVGNARPSSLHEFRAQSCLGDADAYSLRKCSGDEPAIDWSAAERGPASQRRPTCREGGKAHPVRANYHFCSRAAFPCSRLSKVYRSDGFRRTG